MRRSTLRPIEVSTVKRTPIDANDRDLLATALGDTPESVVPLHLLRRSLCNAYIASRSMRFGAIIQNQVRPGDVFAMGDSAELIWELLGEIDGWRRISAQPGVAGELGAIIERETGNPVGYVDAVYKTLRKPAPVFHDSIVRELTLKDLPLLESAAPEVRGHGFGDVTKLLDEGIVACAIVDGEIVTCACTEAVTERHADIRVSTLEPWRGRAFATAAASVVARLVQDAGRVPVWNAKHDDYSSLRIADKLGFEEVSRRTLIDRDLQRN